MTSSVRTSRRNILSLLGSAAAGSLLPKTVSAATAEIAPEFDAIPYTVSETPWPTLLGNHRIPLSVEKPAEAVHAYIPWRRVDDNPEAKAMLLFDPSGAQVLNIVAGNISAESGHIVFEAKLAGVYLLYYLPQAEMKGPKGAATSPKGQYLAPKETAVASWASRFSVSHPAKSWQHLPQARVVEFEARTALDSFYPMEVAATAQEVQQLCASHPQPFLLFAESRERPIQMTDVLPGHWAQHGPQDTFSATALRGEFYVFQIGVYANPTLAKAETALSLRFEDVKGTKEGVIPAAAWVCFNTGGVDPHGVAFQKGSEGRAGADSRPVVRHTGASGCETGRVPRYGAGCA